MKDEVSDNRGGHGGILVVVTTRRRVQSIFHYMRRTTMKAVCASQKIGAFIAESKAAAVNDSPYITEVPEFVEFTLAHRTKCPVSRDPV